MANYATLKAAIQDVVKTNGNNEITGALLQQSLLAMINSLGASYQLVGVAQQSTSPGTPDHNVAYLAGPGSYPNFNTAIVPNGYMGVFKYNGSWIIETVQVGKLYDTQINDIYSILSQILGAEAVTINLSDYDEQVGTISGGKFHNSGGNYPNWRFVLVPVSEYAGRTLHIVPRSTSYGTQYTFINDDILVNNVAPNFSTGYSDTVTNYTQFDVVVPTDAQYLYIRTQNVSTGTDYKPQSIVVTALAGLLEQKVDKVAGKGLSTNDYTGADKAKVDSISAEKFGVKWSLTDINDLGQRTFGAVGMTATIGIGNTNGHSDFDSLFPWSQIKRCNITTNSNGAKIVTFEGETGFALDGSNGDVFVRIPKFKSDRYVDSDGKMNVVIGDGFVHPAFVENGQELDEIFIGAFEASVVSNLVYSRSGLIPGNNITAPDFLEKAAARGVGYSLADMRCADLLWRLAAVEFGCRNSNQIFGYGYADYRQPDQNYSWLFVTVAATNTNVITIGKPTSNTMRLTLLSQFAPGNNLTICDGNQATIVAQRKITDVQCASTNDNVVITFSGTPIDVTTTMFAGNAPCDCNYCESIDSAYKLNWHTGRTNRPIIAGTGMAENTINPCRYRWVENPVGNVWQFLPDIKFNNLQMYVCKNMKDYNLSESFDNYEPIGALLPLQSSNGNKADVNTVSQPNYWITALLDAIFARGCSFAKSFDTVHDGTLTSTKGYGGYYYLNNGFNIVSNGGGFDHLWRCNMLTFRAQHSTTTKWFLYGARLMYKHI